MLYGNGLVKLTPAEQYSKRNLVLNSLTMYYFSLDRTTIHKLSLNLSSIVVMNKKLLLPFFNEMDTIGYDEERKCSCALIF